MASGLLQIDSHDLLMDYTACTKKIVTFKTKAHETSAHTHHLADVSYPEHNQTLMLTLGTNFIQGVSTQIYIAQE